MQFFFNFCHLFPRNVALYKPQPNRSPNKEVAVNGNHCKSNGFHTDTRLKGKKMYMHNSTLFWDIIQLSLKTVAIFL